MRAYQEGLTADIVQVRDEVGGEWGPVWTVPPRNPEAMARAARQFARSRALAVRHCRRARLRGPSSSTDVVVVTELPTRQQTVVRLEDGVTLQVQYLEDTALVALSGFTRP